MKNALFMQSWYSHATDNWYPWLETELKKKGYETHFPDIEEFRSNMPDLEKILAEVEALNVIDEETVIIGHSLGSLVAMRLAERHAFKQMIVLSAWDFNELTTEHQLFWKTGINHAKIIQNTSSRHVVHSDNDPYITAITAEDMSKRLSASFMLIPGGGHFGTAEGTQQIPELLSLL